MVFRFVAPNYDSLDAHNIIISLPNVPSVIFLAINSYVAAQHVLVLCSGGALVTILSITH